MSRFLEIRKLLGLTQEEMAEVLGCVQSNVSFLDRGQTVTPEVAGKLIDAARALGVALTFDHIYDDAPLPGRPNSQAALLQQRWPELIAELRGRGWTLVQISARTGGSISQLMALERDRFRDAPHALGAKLLHLHSSDAKPAQLQEA